MYDYFIQKLNSLIPFYYDLELLVLLVASGDALDSSSNGLALAVHDHGSDDEWLVGGLEVGVKAVLLEALVGDLTALAGEAGDIGWEAVHVEGLAVLGGGHHLLIALPVDVLLVELEALLLGDLEAIVVLLLELLSALSGDPHWSPALRVDDIGVDEGLAHVVADLEGTAGLGSVLLGDLDDLWDEVVALWVSEDEVGAEAGKESDEALWDGEWLAIGWGVCPAHDDLLAAEGLERAEDLDEVAEVGHSLGWVILIALKVDDAWAAHENLLLSGLGDGVSDLKHVLVASTKVKIITDTDDLSEEGHHSSGLADGFTVGDLGLALIKISWGKAEHGSSGHEGEASTGGVVAEDGSSEARVEAADADVVGGEFLKSPGAVEGGADGLVVHVPCAEPVFAEGLNLWFEGFEFLDVGVKHVKSEVT